MYYIPLNDATEARYAEIARKMLETGDWITLWHDYGLPFWAKPPLSTWLSALSMQFFGVNAFAVRLPSLLLSMGILALVGHFLKKNASAETAKLSVLILASNLFFFIDAGAVMTDPSLLFCTTLACLAFWEAFNHKNTFWGYVFFASIGLGLLAKGPLMLVLTALPVLAWLLFYKQMHRLWKALPWIKGSLLVVIIALPWYLAAEYRTPGFLKYFIAGEHFGRFLIPGWTGDKYGFAHNQPPGMIWLYFVLGFLPWSVAAIYQAYYSGKASLPKARALDSQKAWFSLWMLTPLCFFSFARNIIYTYSFTALPPAAILLASFSINNGEFQKPKNRFFLLAVSSGILSLLITWLSCNMPEKINNSQKPIIAFWKNLPPKTGDKILYWSNSKSYSAEFYSDGRVVYLDSLDKFKKYTQDAGIYYIVANVQDLQNLPMPGLMNRLYQDRKKVLLSFRSEKL